MTGHPRAAALLFVLTLVAAACGDGSADTAGPRSRAGRSDTTVAPTGSRTSDTDPTTTVEAATTSRPPETRPPGTTTPPRPRPRTAAVYDNTGASEACRLLSKKQIQAAFGGPVGEPLPVDPFCQWSIGTDAWVSLQIYEKPIGTFRSSWGAAPVGDVDVDADEGNDGYFANNKALVFGKDDRTFVLGWQRSGTWDDHARPRQVVAARSVLDNLASPQTKPPDVAPAPSVDVTRSLTTEQPLRIWVGGDSLAGGPSWAIGDQLDRTGKVRSQREFHVGSGLANRDYLDWHKHLQAEVDAYQSEVIILMFGANDGLPITANGAATFPGDPRWTDAYRQRVEDILDVTATDGRVVMWVGLPPMQDATLSANVEQANRIVAEALRERRDAFFVDIWSMFSAPDAPGTYTDTVTDDRGNPVVARLDGIHLNTEGSLLLARHLYPLLKERVPDLPIPA